MCNPTVRFFGVIHMFLQKSMKFCRFINFEENVLTSNYLFSSIFFEMPNLRHVWETNLLISKQGLRLICANINIRIYFSQRIKFEEECKWNHIFLIRYELVMNFERM